MEINSKEYWEERFKTKDWEYKGGAGQTIFFSKLILRFTPDEIKKDIKENSLSICDWGCAEGDGTYVFSQEFSTSKITGIDISETAIITARTRYRNFADQIEFLACDVDEMGTYDVIISSNTLEHFKCPYEVVKRLTKHANRYLILLVPFQERERIEEHFYTFEYGNIPLYVDNFGLKFFSEIDCKQMEGNYWPGKQILLIFKKDYKLEENYLGDLGVSSLSKELDDAKKTICYLKELQEQLNWYSSKLDEIYASDFWKVASLYYKLRDSTPLRYLYKLFRIYRKEGLVEAHKNICNKVMDKAKRLLRKIVSFVLKIKFLIELNAILGNHQNVKGVIIFPPLIDWNLPLFQRPQHMALNMAKRGYLVFYCTGNNKYDNIVGFKKLTDNLYLTSEYRLLVNKLKKCWICIYSTSWMSHKEIQQLKKNNFIIYDYVDEIDPAISGPCDKIFERHNNLREEDVDLILCVSKKLENEMQKRFRKEKVIYLPNGVEYNRFHINKDMSLCPEKIKGLIEQKPIIGYFGALAKWIDYELINKIAREVDCYIVLIGVDYDGSMKELDQNDNIVYLGIVPYEQLPYYAIWFDVAIIPFKEGEIAKATSPIKLFEYMALNKPVVVTKDLIECKVFDTTLVAENRDDFIEKLKLALKLKDDREYIAKVDKYAKENTWEKRAEFLDSVISEYLGTQSK